MGVSKKYASWTSKFVMKVLQENGRRSDVTFLVQTFWTHPYEPRSTESGPGHSDDSDEPITLASRSRSRRGPCRHPEALGRGITKKMKGFKKKSPSKILSFVMLSFFWFNTDPEALGVTARGSAQVVAMCSRRQRMAR